MTAILKTVPIFGEGVYSRSAVVTRQRRLNCYLEQRKDGDRAKIVAYGTPGLALAFNNGSPGNLPARGMLGNNSALYIVAGGVLQSLSVATTAGVAPTNVPSFVASQVFSGAIGSSVGLVGMALNPTQLLIVDGAAGYVYTPAAGTIVTVGGAFPNGAKTAAYCNGFFICELPGTNQFFVSNLNDGTTWSGLSFAAAVQAIDGIVAADQLAGILVIFSTGHCEFWQNQGLTQEPFVYIANSAAMYGLAAVNSRVHAGDSLYFLAQAGGGSFQNSAGSYQVCRIYGASVEVVSTPDIDNILQTMARTSTIADATAFSYQVDSHYMVQFNFPTANRSLLYDAKERVWGEVQSGLTTLYAARHLGNLCALAFGQTFVGDYANGNVYTFQPGVYTDNGNTILRELITKCAVDNYNTFRVGACLLDMETGVGLPLPTQQGYNPLLMLAVARDGRDFGPDRLVPLGQLGQFLTRVYSRRWGRARTFTLRIRMTDPVAFTLVHGALMSRSRARGASQQAA